MADKNYRANTLKNWRAWVSRAVERGGAVEHGGADAARCARLLDGLPDKHPSLEGVSPEDRADFSRRLLTASKGAA